MPDAEEEEEAIEDNEGEEDEDAEEGKESDVDAATEIDDDSEDEQVHKAKHDRQRMVVVSDAEDSDEVHSPAPPAARRDEAPRRDVAVTAPAVVALRSTDDQEAAGNVKRKATETGEAPGAKKRRGANPPASQDDAVDAAPPKAPVCDNTSLPFSLHSGCCVG